MTTEPTTTMDTLNELREQFKRGTKQAADALADIMGVVDDVFDSLRKPIIVHAPELKPEVPTGPVVFCLSADVFVEVDPTHQDKVTKVRLLPQLDLNLYDQNGWSEGVVEAMQAFIGTNTWAPLHALPPNVVWEG